MCLLFKYVLFVWKVLWMYYCTVLYSQANCVRWLPRLTFWTEKQTGLTNMHSEWDLLVCRGFRVMCQHAKKQRRYFPDNGLSSQSYGFSSGHVWMWELDHEDSWAPKNWCLWTVVLEKTPESPLDCKEIQLVNLKGNQSWVFTGRTDAEAETPILWLLDVKNWLIWKDPDAGKDWRWEDKGMTEDEMVGWHHQLNEHESE